MTTQLPTDWREDAACARVDPDAWYPEVGSTPRPAKAICQDCPAKDPCLEEALSRGERFGVWGGKSERERRVILAARSKQLAELDEVA